MSLEYFVETGQQHIENGHDAKGTVAFTNESLFILMFANGTVFGGAPWNIRMNPANVFACLFWRRQHRYGLDRNIDSLRLARLL